ncbi:MAG: DUF58 domain-containing protein [Gammaproteobacteria bacterium]|nr:DUF58 domain-containing protein [Gammaproteobacteria bacterium]
MLNRLFKKTDNQKRIKINRENSVKISLKPLIKLSHQARFLSLGTRRKVSSSLSGNYASSFKGRGMDFDETRIYQPGDDIRSMDWRVTARTGKPHTKIFKEERERPVFFVTDLSASMHFATRGSFKSVIAAQATALLAWAAADHGDRVGGVIFTDEQHIELPPKARQHGVLCLLKTLEKLDSTTDNDSSAIQTQNLTKALNRLRKITHPGSLIFILSDFYHLNEDAERHFSDLSRHNDIVGILIRDPLEMSPPPPNCYSISNGQNISVFDTSNKNLQEKYRTYFQDKHDSVKRIFRKHRARLIELSTHEDVFETLRRKLNA